MRYVLMIILFALLTGCQPQQDEGKIEMLKKKISKFAETTIQYDENLLDDRQKMVVEKLYQASKIMDELFLQQVYDKNFEIRAKLEKQQDELSRLQYRYFTIMFGPFDRQAHNEPFYGSENKPEGANFYPPDITEEEFSQWIENHPEDEKNFTSEFTVIRREEDKLVAIPYSVHYNEQLTKASELLKEAADYADNETLKRYLTTRADAFLSNDYYQSDMAWMDLKDHTIEVVIGPYEVYEDELFNYKAAFESFITLRDPVESDKLKIFADYLTDIEKNLPIPDDYKNFDRGSESPIVVVQLVFSAGDAKAGVQTLAFNLPNDERVRTAKGSKKVMLKNMHEAKYQKLLYPIAEQTIDPDQLKYVTFEGFFNHTLMHEMSHGVGPGIIKIDGRTTEVKKELKETYSTIEECKADVLGMYNNIFMIEKGIYPRSFAYETYVTFLANTYRTVRFGINEAHGGGNAIIFNYLLEKKVYQFDETKQKVSVDFDKSYDVIKELANVLLTIQATGDYQGAQDLITKYAVESPTMKNMTDKLKDLPIDIKPVFQIEQDRK